MAWKHKLAEWLDPETARDARRHWYLNNKLSEAGDWLGVDFPVVDAVIRWAKVSEVVHFADMSDKLPEPVPGKPWIHRIDDFRAYLRETYGKPTPPAGDRGQG